MAVQLSTAVRNARLDAIETVIGASPKVRIYSGAPPANCAAARTGTLLCEITPPADWLNGAANGSKTLLGSWAGTGTAGAAAGTNAGHYAVMDSAGTTCHEQGTITATGGGGDMTLDNINIAQNQAVTITAFTKNEPHA